MKRDEDSGGMWCLVMFDLPVKTKRQRHAATVFRNMLLDMGYGMVQYSVYVRYTPTQSEWIKHGLHLGKLIKKGEC